MQLVLQFYAASFETLQLFRPWSEDVHIIWIYTTLTNFSTKYLVMCKVYTDVGGIK